MSFPPSFQQALQISGKADTNCSWMDVHKHCGKPVWEIRCLSPWKKEKGKQHPKQILHSNQGDGEEEA